MFMNIAFVPSHTLYKLGYRMGDWLYPSSESLFGENFRQLPNQFDFYGRINRNELKNLIGMSASRSSKTPNQLDDEQIELFADELLHANILMELSPVRRTSLAAGVAAIMTASVNSAEHIFELAISATPPSSVEHTVLVIASPVGMLIFGSAAALLFKNIMKND